MRKLLLTIVVVGAGDSGQGRVVLTRCTRRVQLVSAQSARLLVLPTSVQGSRWGIEQIQGGRVQCGWRGELRRPVRLVAGVAVVLLGRREQELAETLVDGGRQRGSTADALAPSLVLVVQRALGLNDVLGLSFAQVNQKVVVRLEAGQSFAALLLLAELVSAWRVVVVRLLLLLLLFVPGCWLCLS